MSNNLRITTLISIVLRIILSSISMKVYMKNCTKNDYPMYFAKKIARDGNGNDAFHGINWDILMQICCLSSFTIIISRWQICRAVSCKCFFIRKSEVSQNISKLEEKLLKIEHMKLTKTSFSTHDATSGNPIYTNPLRSAQPVYTAYL